MIKTENSIQSMRLTTFYSVLSLLMICMNVSNGANLICNLPNPSNQRLITASDVFENNFGVHIPIPFAQEYCAKINNLDFQHQASSRDIHGFKLACQGNILFYSLWRTKINSHPFVGHAVITAHEANTYDKLTMVIKFNEYMTPKCTKITDQTLQNYLFEHSSTPPILKQDINQEAYDYWRFLDAFGNPQETETTPKFEKSHIKKKVHFQTPKSKQPPQKASKGVQSTQIIQPQQQTSNDVQIQIIQPHPSKSVHLQKQSAKTSNSIKGVEKGTQLPKVLKSVQITNKEVISHQNNETTTKDIVNRVVHIKSKQRNKVLLYVVIIGAILALISLFIISVKYYQKSKRRNVDIENVEQA